MCGPTPPRSGLLFRLVGLVCIVLVIQSVAGSSAQRIPDDLRVAYEVAAEGGCPTKCSCLGKYMECSNLHLRIVPVISDYFTSLDVSQNELTDDVHQSIGNRTKLKELNLSKNQLQKIPVFRGLGDLTKLQLAHNQIEVISREALLALPKLNVLDLSRNRIKFVLPNSFPTINSLQNLNLNDNDIAELENTSLGSLKHLVDLKLNQNHLESLPLDLFRNTKKLKRLDLSGNRIAELPYSTFSNLSKLRILRLSNNRLQTLHLGGFHGLQNLQTLELDGNRLRVIDKNGFFNVSSLATISLRNNSIVSIESNSWEFCQRLVNIDLSHNQITALNGSTFGCLDMLKTLNLKRNAIAIIADGAFNCTTQLESLDLSENHISYTIEDMNGPFKAMRKLNRLDLGDNKIKSINRNAFNGLQRLAQLDLTGNNITSIQSETFAHLPALTELMLNTTNLLCDCNLLWFHGWLSSGKHEQVNVYCDYPSSMRGIRLSKLSSNSFTCNETPKPRIIDEPPPTMLAVTERNVSLTCSATSTSPTEMMFKWKRDNMVDLIPPSSVIRNEAHIQPHTNNTIATSVLTLVNVGYDHVGRYQCVVSNSFGTTYSQRVKITVASFPKFRRIPENSTVNSTLTARLNCAAYGDPQPEIAWQKDGGNNFPAATERRMKVMPDDWAFYIINAKLSDQGVYTCTAENPAGIIKANATLTILEAPSFAKPMESKDVVAGSSGVIECLAIGSPKPSLSWLKDGHPIVISDRHYFAADGQLLIVVDTMDSDAGTYSCSISNDLGTVTGVMQLKVVPAIVSTVSNVDAMTGIVIITVVCCAVATSIIWVFIIYQTRKGRGCTNYVARNPPTPPTDPFHNRSLLPTNGADLLNGDRLNTTAPKLAEMYESQSLLCNTHSPMIMPMNQRTFHPEYNYDDISCKDSGTGDSTKRSHRGVSMQNCTSDNDISCIEIDKTSASVSYKSSPSATVTPSSDDVDRFPSLVVDNQHNASIHLSSPTHPSPTGKVNIHQNKLNEILSNDGYIANTHNPPPPTHKPVSPSASTGLPPDTSSSLNRSNRSSNSIPIVPTTFGEQTVQ